MIAALIEYFTDYEYDYKFYAMHQSGAKFPLYEEIFIYIVFFVDVFIFFAFVVFGLLAAAYALLIVYWTINGLPWCG